MPRMTREQLQQIVSKELPGKRIVGERSDIDTRQQPAPEGSTEELPDLLREYGIRPSEQASSSDSARPNGDIDDDAIVAVEDEHVSDPWRSESRPKAVVISGRTKRVIGQQG